MLLWKYTRELKVLSFLFFLAAIYVPLDIWISGVKAERKFAIFKALHSKNYDSSPFEDLYRAKVFKRSLEIIGKLNGHDKKAKYGMTRFSDMTGEEFESKFLNFKADKATMFGVTSSSSMERLWTTKV